MNERIESLIYESGLIAQGCWDKFDEYDKEALNKFAELIIQTCSALADHFSDGYENDHFGRKMFHYTADVGQIILDHFGVEE